MTVRPVRPFRAAAVAVAVIAVLAAAVAGCSTTAGTASTGTGSGSAAASTSATPTTQTPTTTTEATTDTSGASTESGVTDPVNFCDTPTSMTMHFAAGSMPPPYHYEWTVTVKDGAGELVFVGGYDDSAPTWKQEFDLSPGEQTVLCESAMQWQQVTSEEEGSVGGSTGSVSLVTDAGTLEHKLVGGAIEMESMIGSLLPAGVFDDLMAKYQAYADSYDDQTTSTSTGSTASTSAGSDDAAAFDPDTACTAPLSVELHFSEGSLPPPYHYEWTLTVSGGDSPDGAAGDATWVFTPGYDGDPLWTETFELPAETAARLCAEIGDAIAANGSEVVPGGTAGSIRVETGDGAQYAVLGSAVTTQLQDDVKNGYIPFDVWDEMFAKFQKYQAEN